MNPSIPCANAATRTDSLSGSGPLNETAVLGVMQKRRLLIMVLYFISRCCLFLTAPSKYLLTFNVVRLLIRRKRICLLSTLDLSPG